MLPSCFTLSSSFRPPLRSFCRSIRHFVRYVVRAPFVLCPCVVRTPFARRPLAVHAPSARYPLAIRALSARRSRTAALTRLDALENDNAGFEIEDANNNDDEASLGEQDQC
ncbi:hypothetical protein DEO72_LG5g1650 [Vigna unguiculata]|uniref:Uncharacterized protein n=1 Tax=Vigna unguiculata TaxID=3917 RepID=A0A4D6LXW6_VIGUN|nr:hypothetical protein DEO72_LG5g1650 [Vigna unguiculata]